MELESLLKKYFGYSTFRSGQREVIEQLIEGKDVIALLPTGMGKSLCYQLPGYIFNKPVLIISPLLSLMQDQVEQLKHFGEKRVVAINSFLSSEQKRYAIHFLEQYRFIFISPEMLLQQQVKNKLSHMELSLIVVDEAHCISQWGFDFRPDYLRIGEVFSIKKRPPILALTATATPTVLGDIRDYLKMDNPYQYIHSVDRPNIKLSKLFFQDKDEKIKWILNHVTETEGPGIIYTKSRAKTEDLSEKLLHLGISAASYHAGKDTEDRQFIQQQFIEGTLDWIVATNAFGMGVNKQNVRQIIHESLPSNVANYMQEIGRAGRDGKEAIAILLYAESDEEFTKFIETEDLPNDFQVESYVNYQIQNENPTILVNEGAISDTAFRVLDYWMSKLPKEQVKEILQNMRKNKIHEVEEMVKFVHTNQCMREFLVNYFGQTLLHRPDHCCQSCGLDINKILNPRQVKDLTTSELSWQKRIEMLLLGKL